MRCSKHAAFMVKRYRILVGMTEGSRSLERNRRYEDNIKANFRNNGMVWFGLYLSGSRTPVVATDILDVFVSLLRCQYSASNRS
jgi:hypothetical protein